MAIICGRRTKRSIFGSLESSVDLKFKLKAIKFEDQPKNCDQICNFFRIPQRHCSRLCVDTYKKFLKASLLYARQQLSGLFNNRSESVRFNVKQRRFEPESIRTSDVIIECEDGMVERSELCGT